MKHLLHAAVAPVTFSPDPRDVERRAAREARSRRVKAGIVGVLAGSLAISVVVLSLGRLGSQSSPARNHDITMRPAEGSLGALGDVIPEGSWLLTLGNHGELIKAGGTVSVLLPGLLAHDVSPDGTTVVATTQERAPSGLSLQRELVLVDTATGEESIVVRVAANESLNEPILWSPDGKAIAYALGRWKEDPTDSIPPDDPLVTVCVLTLSTSESQCFSNLASVFSFDWAPSGGALVVGGPGDQPLQVLDVTTGEVSELMPPGGTSSVRDALANSGLGEPTGFFDVSWSPSGKFVAAYANVTLGGSVPVVISTDGQLAALGRDNPEAPQIEWSPVPDTLAYTTGLTNDELPGVTSGVRLLDPATGDDTLLLSTENYADPSIFAIAWSPSGRWIALDGSQDLQTDTIRVIDTQAVEPVQETSFDAGEEPATLKDWSL